MINLLSHNTDSIPLILKKNIVASIDSIPANDFFSYEFLPLDSSKLFYDIDRVGQEVVFLGIEGLARPFIQQVGGVVFLVFTLLFVFSALVFKSSGLAFFGDIRYMISLGTINNRYDNKLTTTFDFWSTFFYLFQTFIIFSILFFYFGVQQSSLYYSNYDYLILFSLIFAAISLFVLLKYLFYRFIGSVFSKRNIKTLINTYLSVIYLTGIVSFMPIFAYIYIPETRLYVLPLLLVVFIVGRIAVFIQSFVFFKKADIGSFYFFVYLCGIEILPYFLLYKAVVSIN